MTLLTLPRADVPIDAAGNLPSQALYRWMTDITQRAGGITGVGTEDLLRSQFDDAGIEETKQIVEILARSIDQEQSIAGLQAAVQELARALDKQTNTAALEAELNELQRTVQGMQQGTLA